MRASGIEKDVLDQRKWRRAIQQLPIEDMTG